jgi:hypothetical protein
MSTNFYVVTMGDTPCESCGHTRADQKIDTHLGQRAAGWEFLYRADPNWTAETAYEEWTKRIRTARSWTSTGWSTPSRAYWPRSPTADHDAGI